MKKPTFPALAAVLAPVIAVAQLERLSSHEENAILARLPALAEAAKGTPLVAHLDHARAAAANGGDARSAGVLAARVAAGRPIHGPGVRADGAWIRLPRFREPLRLELMTSPPCGRR